MFGGGGPGGFFNLGAPEVVVIGAVAWVILGPKELFRLSREAGKFLGEWQQLGQQAKDQFQSALEDELDNDEVSKAKNTATSAFDDFKNSFSPPPPAPAPSQAYDDMPLSEFADIPPESLNADGDSSSSTGGGSTLADIPPLSEYASGAAARADGEGLTDGEAAALRESMYDTLGDPSNNAANFAEQISGARNAAILDEYPAELGPEVPGDGSPMDVQSSEEQLLQNQIDEAENQLATLQAEKSILGLKRKQLEANAARAQRMAEELAEAAETEEQGA